MNLQKEHILIVKCHISNKEYIGSIEYKNNSITLNCYNNSKSNNFDYPFPLKLEDNKIEGIVSSTGNYFIAKIADILETVRSSSCNNLLTVNLKFKLKYVFLLPEEFSHINIKYLDISYQNQLIIKNTDIININEQNDIEYIITEKTTFNPNIGFCDSEYNHSLRFYYKKPLVKSANIIDSLDNLYNDIIMISSFHSILSMEELKLKNIFLGYDYDQQIQLQNSVLIPQLKYREYKVKTHTIKKPIYSYLENNKSIEKILKRYCKLYKSEPIFKKSVNLLYETISQFYFVIDLDLDILFCKLCSLWDNWSKYIKTKDKKYEYFLEEHNNVFKTDINYIITKVEGCKDIKDLGKKISDIRGNILHHYKDKDILEKEDLSHLINLMLEISVIEIGSYIVDIK